MRHHMLTLFALGAAQAAKDCHREGITELATPDEAISLSKDCPNFEGDIQFSTSATGDFSLDGLMTMIGPGIQVSDAPHITSIASDSLYEIQGMLFYFANMSSLQTLSFPNLTTTGSPSSLKLVDLPKLKTLDLNNKFSLTDYLVISNTGLASFTAWSLGMPDGDGIEIEDNTSLETIGLGGNFEQPCFVGCMISIRNNAASAKIGLPDLVYAGDIMIDTFSDLSIPLLASVGNSLIIRKAWLDTISAPNLESVLGTLNVTGSFTQLLLPSLAHVGGDLHIRGNQGLNCDSFETLAKNGGVVGSFSCEGKTSFGNVSSTSTPHSSQTQSVTLTQAPTPLSSVSSSNSTDAAASLSTATRAGIGVSASVAMITIVGLLLYCWRRKGRQARGRSDSTDLGDTGWKNPTLLSRLGLWSFAVIVLGMLVIFGAIAFLGFLWGDNGHSETWRNIVLANWATRSITLTSIATRTSVSLQAGACASMLAAVAFSRADILLPDTAAVSAIRQQSTGIHNLVMPFFRALWARRAVFLALTALALSFTTLAVQFMSTILLSDLSQSPTLSDVIKSDMPCTAQNTVESGVLDHLRYSMGYSYWSSEPATFPTFAEWAQGTIQRPGWYDTGATLRAFLPIQNRDERSALHYYTGNATVVDSRAFCARPIIQSVNLSTLGEPNTGPNSAITYLGVEGVIGVPKSVWEMYYYDPIKELSFNCTAPLPISDSGLGGNTYFSSAAAASEFPVAFCWISSSEFLNLTGGAFPATAYNTFLVLNTTGSLLSWLEGVRNHSSDWSVLNDEETTSEWEYVENQKTQAKLGMSLCFLPNGIIERQISCSNGSKHTEPILTWNESGRGYDTRAVRESLAATNLSFQPATSRGHLSLTPLQPVDSTGIDITMEVNDRILFHLLQGGLTNRAVFMCSYCNHDMLLDRSMITTVHPALAEIFNRIVQSTTHPALALQALFTILFGSAYYDYARQFDLSAPAEYTMYASVLRPTQWTGLIAVIVVLSVHCILVAAVLVWFVLEGHGTLIGGAWSVFAQTASEDMETWLKEASTSMSSDSDVRRRMKSAGLANRFVGVARDDALGKVNVKMKAA